MRSMVLQSASFRIRVFQTLLVMSFAGLGVRAIQLGLWDTRGGERGERQIHAHLRLPPERGLILDRRGVELAITLTAPSIYAVPSELRDVDATARVLADILKMDPAALAERLRERERFTFIKRWAPPEEAEQVRARALPGVGVANEPRRTYPAGSLAANLLGFADIDGRGVRAIERQEDAILRGRTREIPVERDAKGRLLVVEQMNPRGAAGGDIRLTIDAAFQAEVEQALQNSLEATGSRAGLAVALDPLTGDVLSLAEAPSFDPNAFRRVDYAGTRSRTFLDAFEPGSTLKVFLVAGALEAGVIGEDERLDTGLGQLAIPGKTVRDHVPHGRISIGDVLALSSNVGAVMIGQRLGPKRHAETLRAFGFGSRTGSGFPSESAGVLRPWQQWRSLDHATISFGQGVSITPIQLAAATAALAGGGVWRTPRLVAARRPPNGEWRASPPARERRVVSAETASTLLRMMEGTVSAEGTGRRAALKQIRVAGKTGTAQKFDQAAGHYSHQKYVAWFIGVVPADHPRLAIVVALDEPASRAHGGGDIAAPLFARVATAGLAGLGIITSPQPIPPLPSPVRVAAASPSAVATQNAAAAQTSRPGRERAAAERPPAAVRRSPTPPQQTAPTSRTHAAATAARNGPESEGPDRQARRVLMPDFRGETVASVLRMAAQDALLLELIGDEKGLAVDQDPSPGTIVMGSRPRVRVRFTLDSGEG